MRSLDIRQQKFGTDYLLELYNGIFAYLPYHSRGRLIRGNSAPIAAQADYESSIQQRTTPL